MSIKAPALILRAGITYRQLDYWTRRGYIVALPPVGGQQKSGVPRIWTDREASVCVLLARLVRAGIEADRAAIVARLALREPSEDGTYPLGPGVTITISAEMLA